jgi:hypothetical protein
LGFGGATEVVVQVTEGMRGREVRVGDLVACELEEAFVELFMSVII